MKKLYILGIVICFAFLACKAKTKPDTKSKSEGGKIETTISANDQVYNAIARIPQVTITAITSKNDLKAGDVTKFKNKVFLRESKGLWTAIGVANNYDIYYTRSGSTNVDTVVKQAGDPNYFDARKLIIPPAYKSDKITLNDGISFVAQTAIPAQDDRIFSNVRIAWVGRASKGNPKPGQILTPVTEFDIRPGDNFGANASYGIFLYTNQDKYIDNSGAEHNIEQSQINDLISKTKQYPRYSIEQNPSGHPSRKWVWYNGYNYEGMPQVQFRYFTSYSHKDGYVPDMIRGLDTQTVFFRRSSSTGSAGDESTASQFMETVVSKNLWVTNMSLKDIYTNKPSDLTFLSDTTWNDYKDTKFEIFIAEFQGEAVSDPGTSSYQAAAYDGYTDENDRPTGKIVFINPEAVK